MNNPVVSVIICVYNGERFLAQAIQSVLDQGYEPLELIVVDDASTDSTVSIARGFPEVSLIELEQNGGAPHARNIGIAASKGDYVAFLDADDLFLPGKLQKQVAFHQLHPETFYSFTKEELVFEGSEDHPNWTDIAAYQSAHVAYWPSSMMICREAFDVIGLFEPDYRVLDSTPWFLRARDLGHPGGVVDEVLLHRRIHADNVTHQIKEQQVGLFQALRDSIHRKKDAS